MASDRSALSLLARAAAVEGEGAVEPPKKEGWWTKNVPENMTHISTVQELVDKLAEASKEDKLVVLEVFAPWCGACKALFPKFKKMCLLNDDVTFITLNFEENRKLARGLGVKVLPYFHFYRGQDGRVDQLTASISKINRLRDAIALHKSPRCYLGEEGDIFLPEYPNVHPSAVNAGTASNGGEDASTNESSELVSKN